MTPAQSLSLSLSTFIILISSESHMANETEETLELLASINSVAAVAKTFNLHIPHLHII